MKIKDIISGEIVNVFAIYWINGETLCLGIPRNYSGLRSYRLLENTIIDPVFYGKYVYFNDGLYHWSLIEEKLLDDLLELDEEAYERFLHILKSEGQVSSEFY